MLYNLSALPTSTVQTNYRQYSHKTGTPKWRAMAETNKQPKDAPGLNQIKSSCTIIPTTTSTTTRNHDQQKGSGGWVKFVEMQQTKTMFWPALLRDQIPCTVSGALSCRILTRGLPATCCAGPVATVRRTSWARLTALKQGATLPSITRQPCSPVLYRQTADNIATLTKRSGLVQHITKNALSKGSTVTARL